MFFVLFSGSTPADKRPLGLSYYETLQPILHGQDGFIEETPFGEPTQPEAQLLFAKFADKDALDRWRMNGTHLRIMHHARHNVFAFYRIIVGSDEIHLSEHGERKGAMVVYQRSVGGGAREEDMRLEHVASATAVKLASESKFYVGEKLWMWVVRLKESIDVDEFEAEIERVQGDVVQRMYAVREYTKIERGEAPEGIDEAERQAAREQVVPSAGS